MAADKVVLTLEDWAAAIGHPGVEIFPKQILRELDEDGNPRPGNWLNLSYFGGDGTLRYCVKNGKAVSLEDFVKIAKASRITEEDLNVRHTLTEQPSVNIRSPKTREGRNGLLFSLGCRMRAQGSDERTIRTELTNVNTLADPEQHENFRGGPLPDIELANIIKQVLRYESGQRLSDYQNGELHSLVKKMNEEWFIIIEHNRTWKSVCVP